MTSIAPMLSVRRGAQAIEFYKAAFGAGELFRIDSDDGAMVARLSVGAAEFWLADESPEHLNFSPESLGGGTVRMVMIVDDPDAAFARAAAAGATQPAWLWPTSPTLAGSTSGWAARVRTRARTSPAWKSPPKPMKESWNSLLRASAVDPTTGATIGT